MNVDKVKITVEVPRTIHEMLEILKVSKNFKTVSDVINDILYDVLVRERISVRTNKKGFNITPYIKPYSESYTTILWISRHYPLPKQLIDLRNLFGDIKLVMVSGFIPTVESLIPIIKSYKADIVIPILPLSMISKLCSLRDELRSKNVQKFTILYPDMELLHSGKVEPCEEFDPSTDTINNSDHFRFVEFKILEEVKIITRAIF